MMQFIQFESKQKYKGETHIIMKNTIKTKMVKLKHYLI